MSKTIKRPVNVDMCGGELQNFKLQNLTSAPASPAAGMPYYDSTNNVPKYYDGTSFKEFGRVYTNGTGIDISSSNEISIASTVMLKTDLSVATLSSSYLSYDNSTCELGIAVSNNASACNSGTNVLVTGGSVHDYVSNKLVNYVPFSYVGVASGVASLGSDGKVPSSQLPAFVDDVIDLLTVASSAPATCATGDKYYNSTSSKIFTATGTNTWGTTGATPVSDVIYVATDTNTTYRWSGSTMVNLSNPIGQATESTAGIAEIATTSEVTTGTDDTRFVTPLKLAGKLSGYQTALTFSTGLTNSSGTITVTDYAKLVKNTATGTDSLTLLGTASSSTGGINIGSSSATSSYGIAIGTSATSTNSGVVLGSRSTANGMYSMVLGSDSSASGISAMQIGYGGNSTANTLKVGFYISGSANHPNYTLLDGTTGLIPDDRISSTIKNGAAAGATAVQKFAVNNTALTASGGGVTWSITNSLGTKDVQVAVYEISSGEQIFPAVTVAQSSPYGITIEMLSSSNIAADTYRAVVMG